MAKGNRGGEERRGDERRGEKERVSNRERGIVLIAWPVLVLG